MTGSWIIAYVTQRGGPWQVYNYYRTQRLAMRDLGRAKRALPGAIKIVIQKRFRGELSA